MVVTVVTFKVKRGAPYDSKIKVSADPFVTIVLSFIDKTDEHIYEHLRGWDLNFILTAVIRLEGARDVDWLCSDKVHNTTVVQFSVMNVPYTKFYYFKTESEIFADLESQNYESYQVTRVIHATDHSFDALNSIMKFKDTN